MNAFLMDKGHIINIIDNRLLVKANPNCHCQLIVKRHDKDTVVMMKVMTIYDNPDICSSLFESKLHHIQFIGRTL